MKTEVKKLKATAHDFGDGIQAIMTVDNANMDQNELDMIFAATLDLVPRVYACAFRHIEEFNEEDQELIKVICDEMD